MKKIASLRKNKRRGFTLIELIVVIAILAILAAILLPVVSEYIKDAEDATGAANARTVYTAAAAYVAQKIAAGADASTITAPQKADLSGYLGTNFRGNIDVKVVNGEVTSAKWGNTTTNVTYTFTPATGLTVRDPARS